MSHLCVDQLGPDMGIPSLAEVVFPEYPLDALDALVPPGGSRHDLLGVDDPDAPFLITDQIRVLRARLGPPPGAAEELAAARTRLAEAATKREARVRHAVSVAGVSALVGAVGLLGYSFASPVEQSQKPLTTLPSAAQEATPAPTPSEDGPKLPSYQNVLIHYAQFGGRLSVDASTQQGIASDVRESLKILDVAHRGKLPIANLPINTAPKTHDLAADGVTIKGACSMEITPMSEEILRSVAGKAELEEETLDVIVVNTNKQADPCLIVPIAHAHRGDVIVYRPDKFTAAVSAHEINHHLGYYHDQRYVAAVKNGTVTLTNQTEYTELGNTQTVAGDGARALEMTDKDPLSGFELLRNGVIESGQVATVDVGKSETLQVSALTAAGNGIKLINLPLIKPGTPPQADSIMLELSNEDDKVTLKAYGTGTIATEEGTELGATYLIPLDNVALGLGRGHVNKPITIDLGGAEKIQLTLKSIGVGPNATATVTVGRI